MPSIGTTQRPAYVYDQETDTWVPIGTGPHTHTEYIPVATLNAKGALISATAGSVPAVLSVGTTGFFLRANSSTATGLEWAAVTTDPNPNIFLLMGA